MISRNVWISLLTALVAGTLVSCGALSKKEKTNVKVVYPELSGLHDLREMAAATPVVVKAAQAVVRINGNGTGFFVSQDGLLMTNNHIVGTDNCSQKGCPITLDFDFQKGTNPRFEKLYAYPLLVRSDLDMTFLQLYRDASRNEKFSYPHYLEFTKDDAESLKSQNLVVIGHPHAALKRWAMGQVLFPMGKWFATSHFALGGNSGSPFINDVGRIVGILHRGPELGMDVLSENGVANYSIGTPAKEITDALVKLSGLSLTSDATGFSLTADVSDDARAVSILPTELLSSDLEAPLDDEKWNELKHSCGEVLTEIATHGAEVAQDHYATPELLEAKIQLCADLAASQECRASQKSAVSGSSPRCLKDDQSFDWAAGFYALSAETQSYFGRIGDLVWATYSYSSAPADDRSYSDARLAYEVFHGTAGLSLVDLKALMLLTTDQAEPVFAGVHLLDRLLQFDHEPGYQNFFDEILSASISAFEKGLFHKKFGQASGTKSFNDFLNRIIADKHCSLLHQLTAETVIYLVEHEYFH